MPDLLECFLRLNNLDDMQRQIRQKLGLKNVYIVPGDSDNDKTAKEELGRRGAAAPERPFRQRRYGRYQRRVDDG